MRGLDVTIFGLKIYPNRIRISAKSASRAQSGNGFVFTHYDAHYLLVAITRAYAHLQHPRAWKKLMVRGMKQSSSWELPAREYIQLYKKALHFKYEKDPVD